MKRGYVLRILKALYGLKQAPRNWYLMIDKYLKDTGFKSNLSDVGLYTRITGDTYLILLLYVDDVLVAGNRLEECRQFTKELGKKFRLSNEGELTQYLNINIHHDRIKREVSMSMQTYIVNKFKHYGLSPKVSVGTPMQENGS